MGFIGILGFIGIWDFGIYWDFLVRLELNGRFSMGLNDG